MMKHCKAIKNYLFKNFITCQSLYDILNKTEHITKVVSSECN